MVESFITLATAIGQLGIAVMAYKLALALKERVDNHETRIEKLEGK